MVASSTMLKAEEYTHIKGYEWLVLNHERYRDCLKEHYSYLLCECCGFPSPAAACSFLNSVVSRASTLFDEATVDFCLDESLPLKVALLPANLLCVAVTVAYQLQTLPSSVVFGMQFMSDAILGRETEGQAACTPFCCATPVSVLRQQLQDHRSASRPPPL